MEGGLRHRGRGAASAGGPVRARAILSAGLAAAVLLPALPCPAAPPGRDAEAVPEAQVAAEMVERFTRFIEWPEDALGPSAGAFVLCLAGEDDVAPRLEALARARRFKDRPVEVRHLSEAARAGECHLVWLGSEGGPPTSEVLARTGGRPVLTIGDRPGLGERGALLNLRRTRDRLGFEVNLREVRRSRMAFSSKLLRLGTQVGPEREAAP